jgi:hypothetical protein
VLCGILGGEAMAIGLQMSGDVQAAVIGAAVGATFAYGGGWLQAWLNRRRKRRSLATILLSELRAADVTLRSSVYADPSGGFIPTEAFKSFTLLAEAVECFSPTTVSALLDFGAYLDSIRNYQGHIIGGTWPKSPSTEASLRVLATIAVNRVVPLKAALEKKGGTYKGFVRPDIPSGLEPSSTQIPPLPPSPFPDIHSPER